MVAAPHLVRAGGGSIILINSAAGIKVQPLMVPYTTSKFAVRGMAKAFAAELGRHTIRVNSVHPTGVATPMGSAQPQDVADTVLFLASDESRFITAHELAPDAGVTEF